MNVGNDPVLLVVLRFFPSFTPCGVHELQQLFQTQTSADSTLPASEFIRLLENEQASALLDYPPRTAITDMLVGILQEQIQQQITITEALLDSLFDLLQHVAEKFLKTNSVQGKANISGYLLLRDCFVHVAALCTSPSDSVRWKALRILLAIDYKKKLTKSDPRVLMSKLVDSAFDMAIYLPMLGSITIQTKLLPLSPDQTKALYLVSKAAETAYFTELSRTQGTSASSGTNWLEVGLSQSSAEVVSHVKKVEEEIGSAMQEIMQGINDHVTSGFFVKLSTRSPKDSLALRRLGSTKVSCASEALELLCCSQRVQEDCLNQPDSLSIAIRSWRSMPRWSEMRGFCVDGRLTCLSQYFAYQFFPELYEHAVQYIADIKEFFSSQVAKRLPYKCAGVDFALVEGKLMVLELNPFARTTGACLFKWCDDFPVMSGAKPFEARLLAEDGSLVRFQ